MELLSEGCSLGLLAPAATVSCSSPAYGLCNCHDFFLSFSLFFHSFLRDFLFLFACKRLRLQFASPLLRFASTFTSTFCGLQFYTSSILYVEVPVYVPVYVPAFPSSILHYSRLRSRLQDLTSSLNADVARNVDRNYKNVLNPKRLRNVVNIPKKRLQNAVNNRRKGLRNFVNPS